MNEGTCKNTLLWREAAPHPGEIPLASSPADSRMRSHPVTPQRGRSNTFLVCSSLSVGANSNKRAMSRSVMSLQHCSGALHGLSAAININGCPYGLALLLSKFHDLRDSVRQQEQRLILHSAMMQSTSEQFRDGPYSSACPYS